MNPIEICSCFPKRLVVQSILNQGSSLLLQFPIRKRTRSLDPWISILRLEMKETAMGNAGQKGVFQFRELRLISLPPQLVGRGRESWFIRNMSASERQVYVIRTFQWPVIAVPPSLDPCFICKKCEPVGLWKLEGSHTFTSANSFCVRKSESCRAAYSTEYLLIWEKACFLNPACHLSSE